MFIGWFAAPLEMPPPPVTEAIGVSVAMVLSSRAMMLRDGEPAPCGETLTATYSCDHTLVGSSSDAAVTAVEPPPYGLIWYATTGTSVVIWNASEIVVPDAPAFGTAAATGHSGAAPVPPLRNTIATSPGGIPTVSSYGAYVMLGPEP